MHPCERHLSHPCCAAASIAPARHRNTSSIHGVSRQAETTTHTWMPGLWHKFGIVPSPNRFAQARERLRFG